MGNVSATRRKHSSKDLEKYCKPTGLYETCPWEERVVRRWILEGDVAPRYPGSDAPGYVTSGDGLNNVVDGIGPIGRGTAMSRAGSVGSFSGRSSDIGGGGRVLGDYQEVYSEIRQKQVIHTEECPICFMHYQGVNHTVCCSKPLCTECYLQVRPPRTSVVCPFCNCSKFSVEYLGPPSKEDSDRLLAEEQRTIEARIHAEQEENFRQMEERRKRDNAAVETGGAAASSMTGGAASSMTGGADASAGGVASRSVIPPAPKVVLSTVAERRMTEMQIRNQHIRQPRDRRSGPRRGTRLVHRQASVDSDSSNDFQNHGDVRGESGLEGEIQQVEDLMLMEALRLSVLEEQARRERSGDMRRAASAAMSSSAGWGGSGGEGVSTSSRVMGEIARISANYWDRLPTVPTPPTSAPTISASTSASSSTVAPTIPTANRSAGEPAPPTSTTTTTTTTVSASVAPSSSSSGDDPYDLFSEGGLSRWVDVRRIQADLMEGRRGTAGGGGGVTGTGALRATEEASEAGEPQSTETFMQSLRATLERSPTEGVGALGGGGGGGGGALGPYARAASAAPPEQTSMRNSVTAPAVEDPIGSIIRTIRSQDGRFGRAPDRTVSMRGNSHRSMQRGGGRLRSEEFGGSEGYLPQLPESEDEQLKLAIALSLRMSGEGGEAKVGDGVEREVAAARASSIQQDLRMDGAESSASGKERAPTVVEGMEQEGKHNESEPDVIVTGAAASIAEPASRSEEGHEEEVIRKLSAPASEDSSEARPPDPDDSNKGASSDLFEAAVDDLAFFAAAATGRSHSDAWSPSQQRRSGRLPFSPVFPLDEEEKEGESKGADDDGGGLRSTEEQELTVLETGGGQEAVDSEPLGESKSESIPAEEGGDCAVGGVATSPSPCGDWSGAVGGVSSVPVAVDAGDTALPVSPSESPNMFSSDLIGGGGVGGELMTVDATMAVGEASGAGSSSLPSPGLETDSGVNMEDEVTVAVEERGETSAEVVCEEVEESNSNNSST